MAIEKFYIGYLDTASGLTSNVKPYAIPDNAFSIINDAYVFRGRVRKRWGTIPMDEAGLTPEALLPLHSRLAINLGVVPGTGNISGSILGGVYKIGQQFRIGNEILTVVALGAPGVMITTGASTVHTFDTTNGAYVINGLPVGEIAYFYMNEPVMGIHLYEQSLIFGNPTIAFDTRYSYRFIGDRWENIDLTLWTGDNSQFFWTTTYRGSTADSKIFFATNNNVLDPIRYYNGVVWADLNPVVDALGTIVNTCLCIADFKNRLLLFNTTENGINYPNRIRFSAEGSPIAVDAWLEISGTGKANYLDSPDLDPIVSIEYIKDRLIVFMADSTYELVYTGNEIFPFRLQKINTELGAESTFSTIPFDKYILTVGKNGIHQCNGSNVERIDTKIPNEVFDVHFFTQGTRRVYGVRDYYTELAYWTFPDVNSVEEYPNRVLVYNYRNDTWSFFKDTYTCFGYYEKNDEAFNLIPEYIQVLAGNQQGSINIVSQDTPRNALYLSITNITFVGSLVTITSPSHNLFNNDFVYINFANGITALNDNIYKIISVALDTFTISQPGIAGVYTGGGFFAKVSKVDITTKEYSFFANQDRNVAINRVDCFIDKTEEGEITFDSYPSSTELSMIESGTTTGAIVGNGILSTAPYALVPLEQKQSRLWHAVYPQLEGTSVTFHLYLNDDQMLDQGPAFSDFQLHAMVIYARPTRYRMG